MRVRSQHDRDSVAVDRAAGCLPSRTGRYGYAAPGS